jgi:Mg2+-importing ATPase
LTERQEGSGDQRADAYWSLDTDDVYAALGTSREGLSSVEAAKRLGVYGRNELPKEGPRWPRLLLGEFDNPMSLILIGVALVSGFLGQPVQAEIILVIVLLSAILGFYNEYRAARMVQDLEGAVSIRALVTRDGKAGELDSRLLVPGDLVTLYIGDIVTADMRIVDSKELQVNEAVLTGESFPVDKDAEKLTSPPSGPSASSDLLFMGTNVVRGTAEGVVTVTGKSTEFGTISRTLARAHPETEFQRGTKKYGNLLLSFTFFLTIAIFGLNAAVGHSLINSLLFALAIAIGMVPELMPAIVTITLSTGAHRMAGDQVLVKRLASMENLGNIDVLCTDKTGTLTEGRIMLRSCFSPDSSPDDAKLVPLALACNTATVGETVEGNPMDAAIWEYAIRNGLGDSAKEYTKVNEIPFDYQRRMMSVVERGPDGKLILIAKGAPESVLQRCSHVEWKGAQVQLSPQLIESLDSTFTENSSQGFRILAIGYRYLAEDKSSYTTEDESDLTLAGSLVFTDPPKKGVDQALAKLESLGVDIRILSGDNELVASKMCAEVGLAVKKVVTGDYLAKMSWTEVKSAVGETTIFARVTPDQKLNIIRALKENGRVVGYMGDGVNDAPALYEADVGISVDSAVDVSKDAADVVLLTKDLGVLANGIEEGRKTFGNTMKYVLMGTSSSFGNMFSASAASVFLPFLPMLPMQILFLNLLYNFANLTLPTDSVDEEYTRWPRRWDIKYVRNFTLFFGPFSSVYDFLTFGIMLFIFGAAASVFQTAWFVESFWTHNLRDKDEKDTLLLEQTWKVAHRPHAGFRCIRNRTPDNATGDAPRIHGPASSLLGSQRADDYYLSPLGGRG